MNGSSRQTAEAAGLLQITRQRMAAAYPFHAHLLSASQFHADSQRGTMAVTVRDGCVTFLYAPAFVVTCSFAELMGVLHHEINHVLFEHVFVDPARYPDRNARIISEEVTVNEWVREPLPGHPVTLAQYPQLPAGEDTETRYVRLARLGSPAGKTVPKSGTHVPEKPNLCTENRATSTENLPPVRPLDDHDIWAESRQNLTINKLGVAVAIDAAAQALTPDERQALPGGIRTAITRLTAGPARRNNELQLGADSPSRQAIPWRRLLDRYVGRLFEERSVFNRPPRRYPQLVGAVPALARRPTKPRVMAVIDTSRSVSRETLRTISGELGRLARSYEVLVVECDAAVRAVYPWRGPIQSVRGRGGTDFRPALAAEFLRTHRADLVIYFTDGHGQPPARRPVVPVVWCLTTQGQQPVDWGRVVRLSPSTSGEVSAGL